MAFTIGALLPPEPLRVLVCVVAVLAALALTGRGERSAGRCQPAGPC